MDDRPIHPGTRRALVPQKQGRAVSKPSTVRIQLSRLSEGSKAIADAIPAPVKAASRHSVRFGGWAVAACLLAAFACGCALYARLLTGPVSFSFLVPVLQTQLNAQVQGYRFQIGDAILRLSSPWALEFRLTNVRVAGNDGEEIATAPFAAIRISRKSLLRLSPAASQINLIGPKVLIFNLPGKGLTLTAGEAPPEQRPAYAPQGWTAAERTVTGTPAPQDEPREIAGLRQMARQGIATSPSAMPFNPAPLLARLFTALENRGGASAALKRVGIQDAVVYFASEKGVSTWRVADLHIDIDEERRESALKGELTLQQNDISWRASFSAINELSSKKYSVTASIEDIVPRAIWQSFPALSPLKLAGLPVSGELHFDIGYDGLLLGGNGEIDFGSGALYAPFDEKHPAFIDKGILKVVYDRQHEALLIKPLEFRWDDNVLRITGAVAHQTDPRTNQETWAVELDGKGSRSSAPQYGAPAVTLDALKLSASYNMETDTVIIKEFAIKGMGGGVSLSGQAASVATGGAINVTGTILPMPISFVKAVWPAFVANGARDWVGSNLPAGNITGGNFTVNLSAAELAALDKDGDIPDSSVSLRMTLSGLQIYHIKGLPPIIAKEGIARVIGRRYVFDVLGEARIEVPSGKAITFTDGQFAIDDLRPHIPRGDIRFKSAGDVASVLELLDQPPLGYVKAVGFKTSFVNGRSNGTFKVGVPLENDFHFKDMTLSGKCRVFDLRSNALPGGLTVNGGSVNFDLSETAVSATGDVKVNNVPVTLVWQRVFDLPAERQPALRAASILSEKARDELGLNINHIVKGDLPIALAVSMQREGSAKAYLEANLTNADVFLTAIGWRKPPGQKATVSMDLSQRADNTLLLDNFTMNGDGLNINGRLIFNDKRRIAGFNFPEFSTNGLTQMAISGELTPQNVLKVQAKGPSYDGRQFFKALLSAGKISDNQPAPIKDEPGLDLAVEIDTVFGYYDSTVKSVVLEAKRRNGKLTYVEATGRLNGEAPIAVHIEQKPGQPRVMVSDATDAGAVFRLTGFYGAVRGGTMNLRVNLDGGGGAEKIGVLDVRSFAVVGDQVVGKVVSEAERERARVKPGERTAGQQVASGEPLIFDRLVVPFAVGASSFNVHDAALNGPLLGATMRGHVDFAHDMLSLSGTYVPLYGVNGMLQGVPVLGTLLTGRDNEGIFGITFAVQGRTSNPDVIVNPVSALAPGLLRQIFEFEDQPVAQVPQAEQSWQAQSQTRR